MGFQLMRLKNMRNNIFVKHQKGILFPGTECDNLKRFLHGPKDIHGIEQGVDQQLVIGAVTVYHNKNYLYQWYKHDILLCSDDNLAVIRVKEPGIYKVVVIKPFQKLYIDKIRVIPLSFCSVTEYSTQMIASGPLRPVV